MLNKSKEICESKNPYKTTMKLMIHDKDMKKAFNDYFDNDVYIQRFCEIVKALATDELTFYKIFNMHFDENAMELNRLYVHNDNPSYDLNQLKAYVRWVKNDKPEGGSFCGIPFYQCCGCGYCDEEFISEYSMSTEKMHLLDNILG